LAAVAARCLWDELDLQSRIWTLPNHWRCWDQHDTSPAITPCPGLRLFQGTARRGRQGWPSRSGDPPEPKTLPSHPHPRPLPRRLGSGGV